jgi:hypothetical protein
MPELTDALEALMAQHRRIGSPVPDYLRSGQLAGTVNETIRATVGLDAPQDLLGLFAWRDGIDNETWERDDVATGFARLFGDTHFAPLADAIGEHRERIETDELVARYSTPDAALVTWKPSWFPAFCRGWDTYAVECDPTGTDLGRIYDPAWEPPIAIGPGPRFRDLLHLVESAVRRFESGGYWWNPADRFLEERADVLRPLYEREIAEARRS